MRETTARGQDAHPYRGDVDWSDPLVRHDELTALIRPLEAARLHLGRGRVGGFSPRSRKRLRQKQHELALPPRRHWLFITLTMPGELSTIEHDPGCPYTPLAPYQSLDEETGEILNYGNVCTCWERWKAMLATFYRRWRREFCRRGELPRGIWAQEFQERGVVHFHLCLLVPDFLEGRLPRRGEARRHWKRSLAARAVITELREWVSLNWFEIVGSRQDTHLAAGTNVEWADGANGCMEYMRRELGKVHQKRLPLGVDQAGRWWGVWGLKVEKVVAEVDRATAARARRLVRAAMRARFRAYGRKLEGERPLVRTSTGRLIEGPGVGARDRRRKYASRTDPRDRARALYRIGHRFAGQYAHPLTWWGRRPWRLLQDTLAYLELAVPPPDARPPSFEARRRRTTARAYVRDDAQTTTLVVGRHVREIRGRIWS